LITSLGYTKHKKNNKHNENKKKKHRTNNCKDYMGSHLLIGRSASL